MSGSVFFDTNVLVHAYSSDDTVRKAQALALSALPDRWLSTQVLIEFVNVQTRHLKTSWREVQLALVELTGNHQIHQTTPANVAQATQLAGRYQLAWFDALIVAAALDCGCQTLYSEDFNTGQLFEGRLRVVNPFGK